MDVLATLLHELCHAATGPGQAEHSGKFVKIARAVGLKPPWTETPPTRALSERLTGCCYGLAHTRENKKGPT